MTESTPHIPDDPRLTEANIAKTEAETAKLIAERIAVEAAEKRAQEEFAAKQAQAREKHEAELSILRINQTKGDLSLELDRITRDRGVREEAMYLACDWAHYVYNFSDVVEQASVHQCMNALNQWVRQAKAQNQGPLSIEIVFDSPGGSVFDGMHLFDYVRWIRNQGHHVTTVALGNAASMAGILIQSGDTRIIGAESYLLIHQIADFRMFDVASTEDLKDREARLRKIQGRILNIFSDRAADTLVTRPNNTLSRSEIYDNTKSLIERSGFKRDWWVDSDEAYELGFVDEIR